MNPKLKKKIDQVEALRSRGMPLKAACAKAHIVTGTYYKHKKPGRKPKEPTHVTVQLEDSVAHEGRLIALIGSPSDVLRVLEVLK